MIQDVGLQLNTFYASGHVHSVFIDESKIIDIFVNEGLRLWQVQYYLAIVVDAADGHQLFVAFPVRLLFFFLILRLLLLALATTVTSSSSCL